MTLTAAPSPDSVGGTREIPASYRGYYEGYQSPQQGGRPLSYDTSGQVVRDSNPAIDGYRPLQSAGGYSASTSCTLCAASILHTLLPSSCTPCAACEHPAAPCPPHTRMMSQERKRVVTLPTITLCRVDFAHHHPVPRAESHWRS